MTPGIDHYSLFCKQNSSRMGSTLIGQLRSGSDFLNHSIRNKNLLSKLCENCKIPETCLHFLKHCKLYTAQRNHMIDQLTEKNINVEL